MAMSTASQRKVTKIREGHELEGLLGAQGVQIKDEEFQKRRAAAATAVNHMNEHVTGGPGDRAPSAA